jgi:hypothetical protein
MVVAKDPIGWVGTKIVDVKVFYPRILNVATSLDTRF